MHQQQEGLNIVVVVTTTPSVLAIVRNNAPQPSAATTGQAKPWRCRHQGSLTLLGRRDGDIKRRRQIRCVVLFGIFGGPEEAKHREALPIPPYVFQSQSFVFGWSIVVIVAILLITDAILLILLHIDNVIIILLVVVVVGAG